MYPQKTYVLKIFSPPAIREDVEQWLVGDGVAAFASGEFDVTHLETDYQNPLPDLLESENAAWRQHPIVVYKYSAAELAGIKSRLIQDFPDTLQFADQECDTRDWAEGWKASFRPIVVDGFWVYPPWEKPDQVPEAYVPICIEPAMAFGTGQHETTRLCLSLMHDLKNNGSFTARNMLDVGTGSGILAIAGRLSGIQRVEASDIDDDAVLAARDNAKRNGVDLLVFRGSLSEDASQQYDLITANILRPVLIELAAKLRAALTEEGRLILSGILVEDREVITKAFEAQGLEVESGKTEADWLALQLRPKALS